MEHNLLTGESNGAFHNLRVAVSGNMIDILTHIAAAGGGGGITGITDVTGSGLIVVSASGTTRQVSVDLSDYSTAAQVLVAIASALQTYSTTAVLSVQFALKADAAAVSADVATLNTLISQKQDILTTTLPLRYLWQSPLHYRHTQPLPYFRSVWH